MTATFKVVIGDASKIEVADTITAGATTTTTVSIVDKDLYIANQYQKRVQAGLIKSNTIEVQDAIIAEIDANLIAIQLL